MSFAELSQMPHKHLPTEVLLSMRDQLRKELSKRGYGSNLDEFQQSPTGGGRYGRGVKHPDEKSFKDRLMQLDAIMAEDWSQLFPSTGADRRFYVYAHVNPRKRPVRKGGEFTLYMPGLPFYIGKGCGTRCWQLNRNEGHGVEIKQLRTQGIADSEIVHLIRENLTESEALEIESKLIYFFGTKFESGRKGILVNLDFPRRPPSMAKPPPDFVKTHADFRGEVNRRPSGMEVGSRFGECVG